MLRYLQHTPPPSPTGKILRRVLKEKANKEVVAETKPKSKL